MVQRMKSFLWGTFGLYSFFDMQILIHSSTKWINLPSKLCRKCYFFIKPTPKGSVNYENTWRNGHLLNRPLIVYKCMNNLIEGRSWRGYPKHFFGFGRTEFKYFFILRILSKALYKFRPKCKNS